MTEYSVTFHASTNLASLEELSDILGETTIGADRESYGYVEWRMESSVARDATLDEHLESLMSQLPVEKLNDQSLPEDCEMRIDIAAFFDDANCIVRVPLGWLDLFVQYGIELEFTCYPCDFGRGGS